MDRAMSAKTFSTTIHSKQFGGRMKRFPYLMILLLVPVIAFGQASKSCCAIASSTKDFAMLANDPAFVATHLDPLPFHYQSNTGKWITFKTSDSIEGRGFEVKASKATNNVVFLFHEWWGLNDYIQREAENLQKELSNVTVIALDLYDKKVAATQADAQKYMGELKEERARSIIDGAIKYVGTKARIGTIGWCLGGGWSMQATLAAVKQGVACVMYYGMPEKDMERIKSLNAPVLFVFASQDQWINKNVLDEFQKGMSDAKKILTVKSYDADHAFANPSNPKFNKEFADDAHKHAVDFFKSHLLK